MALLKKMILRRNRLMEINCRVTHPASPTATSASRLWHIIRPYVVSRVLPAGRPIAITADATLMWYAFICTDIPDSLEKRRNTGAAHLARLQDLRDQGRLMAAGPFPATDCLDPGEAGFTGSLIVAEFDSLEDARAWADEDPYLKAGIYDNITVKPFKLVL